MTGPSLAAPLADLRAEGDLLEELLRQLPAPAWTVPTPAAGWAVRHQVAHLAWTGGAVLSAIENPEAFAGLRERFVRDPAVVDRAAQEGATRPPTELLEYWHDSRNRVLDALAAVSEGGRIPWIGPPLGVATMISARIMETWAHGQDIRDALGRPTGRLAPTAPRRAPGRRRPRLHVPAAPPHPAHRTLPRGARLRGYCRRGRAVEVGAA